MGIGLINLFYFLRNVFTIILVNDYFKRNYPQQYENFIITVSFKIIYLYSKCQIVYIKFSNKIKSYMDTIPKQPITFKLDKNRVKNEICQYVNGEKGKIFITDNILEQFVVYDLLKEDINSIYIYSDNLNPMNETCINKVIISENPVSLVYDSSDIKFILLEVSINDKRYKIDLKSDTYNYYIWNNILNRQFFIYYLKTYNADEISNQINNNFPDILNIKLIDQDVNMKEFEITDTKCIILGKTSYLYR